MTVTETLASFVAAASIKDMHSDILSNVKACLLDWLGSALRGSKEQAAKAVISLVGPSQPIGESSVIATSIKTSSILAALANGVMGHAVEMDDLYASAVIHPASTVMPAALAVAEKKDASGEELAVSIILGYEVGIRLGEAAMPSHYKYWHTTATCGTFGATAAAGKLLRLDAESMAKAFGLAAVQAAGLIGSFGTSGKALGVGRAAFSGVLSAELAEKGLIGFSDVLDSDKGFFKATSDSFDPIKIVSNLGGSFKIDEVIFKKHASCGHTHGAVDAIITLKQRHDISAEDVEEIVVETYPIAVEVVRGNNAPRSVNGAKFSMAYCVAAAFHAEKLLLEEFSEDRIRDEKILGLARKVKVSSHPRYTDTRLGSANVRVRVKGGAEYSEKVDTPKGYPENPMTERELEDKFRLLASSTLEEGRIDKIIESVAQLPELEDIHRLTNLLTL